MKNKDLISPEDPLEKKEKKGCIIVAIVLVCVLSVLVAGLVWIGLELELHQDVVRTWGNMSQVEKGLFQYSLAYGCYPPQQDMESLLETLGLKDSDLQKVRFFDIKTAEYHAPQGEIKTRADYQEPILTIRVRRHVFGKSELYIVQRDGMGYTKR